MDKGTRSNRCSVAVAIFVKDGAVLLGQRGVEEKNYPFYWEFPGGKLEPGERPEQALARELAEELGCQLIASKLFRQLAVDYCGKEMELHYFLVELCTENPRLMKKNAHSELKWFRLDEALNQELLPANRKILEELKTIL